MPEEKLTDKFNAYIDGDEAGIEFGITDVSDADLVKVRDKLLDVGTILEEDLDAGVYVASIEVGFAQMSKATIAVTICDGRVHMAAFSEEPHGAERASEAISVLANALNGDVRKARRRHGPLRIIALACLALAFAIAIIWCVVSPSINAAVAATKDYNEAVESFNSAIPSYNAAAADVSVENIRGMIPEAEPLSIQPIDFAAIARSLIGGNSADKIKADTETVKAMSKSLEHDRHVLEALKNPSEQWIADKLAAVEHVKAVKAVTDDNDPNKLLGNEGGYSSCIYFTTSMFDSDAIAGDDPVAKGVDGGGSIEVYASLDDARSRCEYLSGFDDTALDSGSYALIGTMVIRTSCLLSDESQYILTDEIVAALTND